jgi:orotate phosphoribosyltransferase
MLPQRERRFLELLLSAEVLRFGSFQTKSGRMSPYFFNTGRFDSAHKISLVAELYADLIIDQFGHSVENLFGPAYKGIPLAIATAQALSQKTGRDVTFSFNRKEQKSHGEGGGLIGYQYKGGEKVVVVEDVITGGTSINETLPLLRSYKVDILGFAVGIDRQERGLGSKIAMEEVSARWGIRGASILSLHQIVEALDQREFQGRVWIDASTRRSIDEYRQTYG